MEKIRSLPHFLFALGWLVFFAGIAGTSITEKDPPRSFPYDPNGTHDRDFRPSGTMSRLSPNLFLFEDTCNVYLIKQGERALLIGFGSGKILDHLKEAGVEKVERVLFTHHHRNQSQGLLELKHRTFLVTVPEREARFFEDAEGFWRDVKLHLNYDCRSYWNTLRSNVRVDERAGAGAAIDWQGLKFRVLETPGVTDHSMSYVVNVDGRRVVFCGDLISGVGKIHNWFDLHWDYYGFTQGMDASKASFDKIRPERPDLLLPAHGGPIRDPAKAMEANARIYSILCEMLVPNELHRVQQQVRQILPHLVFVGANCYAILSRSGKAFLWDYGYVERERIAQLKKQFGVKSIDAASFSHYHDDHIIRAGELAWEDTRLWIHDSMLDIIENPARYRLPCLIPMPFRADRILHGTEKVQWEEYSFDFFHLPGQTQFHAGLCATIDGKRVMFTGDNTWNKKDPTKTLNGPLVPHNEYFLDGGFITCAEKMLLYKPDFVCPAHTEEFSPTEKDLVEFRSWAYRLREIMTSLIDQPDPNFGMDVRWCRFYPFRSFVPAGARFQIELLVRNHLYRSASVQVELRLPAGIACDQPAQRIVINGKREASIPFALRRTAVSNNGREVITADITVNGRHLGEYAEAIIDPGRAKRPMSASRRAQLPKGARDWRREDF
jgi:glyoxylase-like metal-dependent hydrolase (beta-lactamase superfamily II)